MGESPRRGDATAETARRTSAVASGIYAKHLKPIVDRVGGLMLLTITLPLLAVAAAVVRFSLGSPVFFRQPRVGQDGSLFQLVKLRTMIPDRRASLESFAGPDRRAVHKSPDDPRVPRACNMLRSLRLDELPQFWNVVKGDMSLVGPRPEMPVIVANYEPWQHERHAVKPGVTGPWQVAQHNGKLMHECTELDLEYIARISFLGDMWLLARTPFAMIRRRGF